jgi:hypothetical protein
VHLSDKKVGPQTRRRRMNDRDSDQAKADDRSKSARAKRGAAFR